MQPLDSRDRGQDDQLVSHISFAERGTQNMDEDLNRVG
jgi:hypothetical protein